MTVPRCEWETENAPYPFCHAKTAAEPPLLIDVVGRAGLDFANNVGRCDIGFEAEQDVRVIGHAVNRDQFLAEPGRDASDVFLQLLAAAIGDYSRALCDRENDVEIDLGIGV